MMATASIEPAEYECPVCNDYFKKPKLLLCGHVLCRDCLLSWLQSNKEALCPLCRCSMINAQVKAENSLGDMVDMLPDDVAMEALVESAKIINTNHICFLHADKAAVAICLQCRESYCQNCSEPHKKSSATRHHHVEDLSTLTAEKLAANRHAVCTTHGDKTAELFCSTHHIPICQVCALLEHRDCSDLLDLKKRADVARGQLEQLLANLTSAELSLKESTSKLDQIESNLEKNTQTVTHSLEETQNYLQRLAKICNQRIAEVRKSNSENKNKIRIAKEDLLKRHGKAVSHKLVVKRVQQTISGSELFDITTKLKGCIGDLVLDATLPADLESFTVPGFTFDVKVLASLADDLSHFGSLPASVTKQNQRSQPQMTENGGSGNAVLINTMPYQMPSPATITTPPVRITPQVQTTPQVQINPKVQTTPQVQINHRVQITPQVQINPQVQIGPQVQTTPQVQINPQVQIGPQSSQFMSRMNYPQIQPSHQQFNFMPQILKGYNSTHRQNHPKLEMNSKPNQSNTQGGTAYPSLFYPLMVVSPPNHYQPPATGLHIGISNPAPLKQEKKSAIIIQDPKDLRDVTDEVFKTLARPSQEMNDTTVTENQRVATEFAMKVSKLLHTDEEVDDDKPKATILGTRLGKGIMKYDRDVLLSLSATQQSRRRPANLPDLPEIILSKPITGIYENLKPFPAFTPGFFVNKKFPNNQKKAAKKPTHQSSEI